MGIRRAEVIEIYNDLSLLTSDKIDQLLGRSEEDSFFPRLSSRSEIVMNMPRDSIRARMSGDDFSIICYPFFPSHLRFPLKVGEFVWVFLESIESASSTSYDPEKLASRSSIRDVMMSSRNPSSSPSESIEIGYWMCRPTSERQIEDLNYTAFGRVKYASGFSMESAADIRENSTRTSRTPTFPYYSENSDTLEKVSKDDERLRQRMETFSGFFDMEPVARYTKAPGETVLAGSHDSRIVLGQVRSGRPTPGGADTGSVDIVAGTGRGGTSPNLVTNTLGSQEVDKDPLLTGITDVESEGDPSFSEDQSRILVAENMAVDEEFTAAISATGGTDTADKSGPAVVTRTQHVRVLAASDGSVRVVVEGPTQSSIVIDSAGNLQIDAGTAVSVRSPSVLFTSTAGSGVTATDVIIESSLGFQTSLANSLTEIIAVLTVLGLPTANSLALIRLLQGKQFSSLITRSD